MRPILAALLTMILTLAIPGPSAAQTQGRPLPNPRDATAVFAAAVAARDAGAIAAMYASDAIALSPNQNPVAGREAIRAAWEANFAAGYSAIVFGEDQRTERGTDRAAHLFVWQATITPPGAQPQTIRGRTLLYMTAVDGGWLISADTWHPIP
jgi:uncharacterized protein (TIGR02246 family)